MAVTDKLERIWREAVVAYFMVLCQQLLGETEENNQNLSQDGLCPGRCNASEKVNAWNNLLGYTQISWKVTYQIYADGGDKGDISFVTC
jgi:hypothetical protein